MNYQKQVTHQMHTLEADHALNEPSSTSSFDSGHTRTTSELKAKRNIGHQTPEFTLNLLILNYERTPTKFIIK